MHCFFGTVRSQGNFAPNKEFLRRFRSLSRVRVHINMMEDKCILFGVCILGSGLPTHVRMYGRSTRMVQVVVNGAGVLCIAECTQGGRERERETLKISSWQVHLSVEKTWTKMQCCGRVGGRWKGNR